MNNKKYSWSVLCLVFMFLGNMQLQAQQDQNNGIITSALNGLHYSIKAGFNVGGTSPIPLPAEIRELKSYNPTVALSIEGNVTKLFNPKWGVTVGLRLETKGMKTDARVKNYRMEMVDENQGEMKGYWTGNVKTKVRNTYLSLPVLANYQLSNRWEIKAGPYFSLATDSEFSGSAYDGYIRDGVPTGEKIEVSNATYDFSSDIKKFQYGAQVGASWKAFSHLSVYADLTWGLNSIFEKDITAITFDMYPIYANLGFAYLF